MELYNERPDPQQLAKNGGVLDTMLLGAVNQVLGALLSTDALEMWFSAVTIAVILPISALWTVAHILRATLRRYWAASGTWRVWRAFNWRLYLLLVSAAYLPVTVIPAVAAFYAGRRSR